MVNILMTTQESYWGSKETGRVRLRPNTAVQGTLRDKAAQRP